MAQKGADATEEEESTKPVSFLLSHFENLAQVEHRPLTPEPSSTSSSFLRAPTPADNPVLGRASLDLPRPGSEWASSQRTSPGRPGIGRTSPQPAHNEGSPGSPGSPGRSHHARPLSMFANPTTTRTPRLTVESPHPSPRNSSQASTFGQAGQESRSADAPSGMKAGRFHRISQRLTTPPTDRPEAVNDSQDDSDHNQDGKARKNSSLPPPVNRAEKPKYFAKKPAVPTPTDTNLTALAPSSQRTSFEDRVSPFSTPPSSPEKLSPPRLANGYPSKHVRSPSHPSSSTFRRPNLEPPPVHSTFSSKSVENKEPGFSKQTGPGAAGHRSITQPPPPPPSLRRNATLPVRSSSRDVSRSDATDDPADRPGLPPRDSPRRSPSRANRDAGLTSTSPLRNFQPQNAGQPRQSLQSPAPESKRPIPPPPRREPNPDAGKVQDEHKLRASHASRSPTRSQEISSTSPAAVQRHGPQVSRDEPADRQTRPDDAPVSRTDYPDASQTNRRPPFFRTGTRGIHTKNDTRVFDVCGQYVCVTGYFTRAWDLVTGEPVMSLSHGESQKGLSIAFKPGRTVDEEGKIVWVGTNTGELLEIDITTESVVSTRSYPSRREIIKIYRHKRELWTVDDEGRLLLWPPDESGSPNLQYSYSNPYDRVAKGHTFSMAVGDILWYATGKEVRIYQPNVNDANFQVLKAPLGKNHSGDVTCGTATKDDRFVYLGHADGKVTIYSTKDYTCLGTVNVSLYKISSLSMVGDYLWAGFKTGMIYVYDTTTCPWTVKKDWLAHEQGVCGTILDPSGIWTVNRLQLVSLGVDNYIRVWDGMLEDDFLETWMQNRDIDYCQFRELTASVLTWNAGATVPGNLRDNEFIRDAIHPENPPDILVFGFQELVNLEDKKITAKSFLKSRKNKDHADAEHMSRQYRVWRDHLASCIHEFMPLDQPYVLLHTANLIGLFTCVFVKQEERQRIRNVSAAEIKRGMGGLHGNKGALVLRLLVDDSSLCFVNCHLAAGQTQTAHRNNDIAAIMESESLPTEPSSTARIDRYVGGGDGSMILDHEICILNGDLNYRIDSMPRNTVVEAIKAQNLPKLLDRDQLLASRRKNPGFRLRSFNEMPITFAPTYKYDVGTDNYDSSEKRRAPAWCDRLLYRGVGRIKQLEYRRYEVRVSDHRPVGGFFKMRIKSITPEKRAAAWDLCQEEFAKEKRRIATEASIDYLVRVVGTTQKEARSLMSSAAT